MSDLKWDFFFDVDEDGKVQFSLTDLDTGTRLFDLRMSPHDAENIADGLKQQADRARRHVSLGSKEDTDEGS